MIKCHLKRAAVAVAIYNARFEGEKPRDRPAPFEELPAEARDIWLHCADKAEEALAKKPRIRIHAVAERRPFVFTPSPSVGHSEGQDMPRTKAKLSDDAKLIAGSLFGMMQPGEGTLSFSMKQSRPTGRTAAALIELVFFEIVSHDINEEGVHVYKLLQDCSSFRRSFSMKKAQGFTIVEDVINEAH